jgi:hypothetical protein
MLWRFTRFAPGEDDHGKEVELIVDGLLADAGGSGGSGGGGGDCSGGGGGGGGAAGEDLSADFASRREEILLQQDTGASTPPPAAPGPHTPPLQPGHRTAAAGTGSVADDIEASAASERGRFKAFKLRCALSPAECAELVRQRGERH